MKITINLDTQAVITQPTPIRVKAASYVAVEISFTRSSQAVRLPEGATIEFALKPLGQFTGDLLAYDNNFALAAGFNYTGTVNLSSQPLLAALGLGDSDPGNDDAQINGSGEITWSIGSQKFRSSTFPVVVEAPLTDESPVATPDPVLYPPPSDVARESDLVAHTSDTNNPHAVTKAQAGLGDVDNTSDADKPISTAVGAALAEKANASDLANLSIPSANISDATPLGRSLLTATEDEAATLDGSETIPAQQGGAIRQLAVSTLAGYIGSVIGATGSNRIVVTDRFSLANLPTPDVNGNPVSKVLVGDVVHQGGTPAVSRTAVVQFVDHAITDDDVNNGYGIRFFDENGTQAMFAFSWFGGSGTTVNATDLANAFANQINCSGLNVYANVTGDGTQVTVTSYTSGPLAGAWTFQDDSNGASMTVTEGTSNLPSGDFIVSDLSNLGNATGYQGIGDTVDFLSGYGAPTADIGEEGNGYVDLNNGDFYHRDASGWQFVLNIKGPQGDQGTQGPQGNPGTNGADFTHPIGFNLKRIALKLPPYAYPTYVLSGGISLRGICFDGAYVWVADEVSLYKLNISDGSVAATYTPNVYFWFLVSDGTYIWACPSGGNLYRINPSTGVATSFSIGIGVNRACCDGTYVYVVGDSNTSIVKVKASDGSVVATYTIPNGTHDVCFDGTYLWIACGSGSLVKMRASDGVTMTTYSIANMPYRVCFDGTNIWVGTWTDTSLSKVSMSDGTVLGCYNMGARPIGLVFDGSYIWYLGGSSATQIRPSNGAVVGTYTTGATAGNGVYDGCFDGSSLWLSNYNSANVGRL